MFYEWVTEGVAFGFKAFFAVFIFMLICAALLGFAALLGTVFKEASGEDDHTHRSR